MHITAISIVLLAACPAPSVQTNEPPVTNAAPRVATNNVPAPTPLVEAAGRFGLVPLGNGWTWTKLDVDATRFDWSGRPAAGDREVLVSFWLPTIDATETQFLPSLVQSAAANLTDDNRPCDPVDQPKPVVDSLHVDRVITVCFKASQNYGKGFTDGVLHGIVNKGTLTIIAILSNTGAGFIPSPDEIGLTASAK